MITKVNDEELKETTEKIITKTSLLKDKEVFTFKIARAQNEIDRIDALLAEFK